MKVTHFHQVFIKNEGGFTGLEAAIVMIAFVVVAAIFSYVMLGSGFSTTQKSQGVVHESVTQASSSLALSGNVIVGSTTDDSVSTVTFYVTNTVGGTPVNLNKTIITYTDNNNFETFPYNATNGAWIYIPLIKGGSAANLVEEGDIYKIILNLNSTINGSSKDGIKYSYIIINSSAQNDYQINFKILWKFGMNTDFSNIRFYANNTSWNNGTSLNYWIEEKNNSSDASFWIPLPANCNRVACEWGLVDQNTSQSNGYLVFPKLFDDFFNNSINTTTWQGNFSGVSISNGICTVTGDSGDQIQSKSSTSVLEFTTTDFRVRSAHYADPSYCECIYLSGFADGYIRRMNVFFDSGVGYGWFTHNGLDGNGVYTKIGDILGYAPNTWEKLSFSRRGTSGAYSINGIEQLLSAAQYFDMGTNSPFVVSTFANPGSSIDIDYVFNHMYNATPPTVTVDSTVYNYQNTNSTSNETSEFASLLKSKPGVNENIKIEVKPPEGAALTFTRTMPPQLSKNSYYSVY